LQNDTVPTVDLAEVLLRRIGELGRPPRLGGRHGDDSLEAVAPALVRA
jgi:hypothetical protein